MTAIPTVTMIGPAGQVVVNHNDEQQWRDRGYRLLGEAAAAASPVAKKEPAKRAPSKKRSKAAGVFGDRNLREDGHDSKKSTSNNRK